MQVKMHSFLLPSNTLHILSNCFWFKSLDRPEIKRMPVIARGDCDTRIRFHHQKPVTPLITTNKIRKTLQFPKRVKKAGK